VAEIASSELVSEGTAAFSRKQRTAFSEGGDRQIFGGKAVAECLSKSIQGCQIFLGTAYQNGTNIPNDPKIYQKAIKYAIAVKFSKWP
jgi:hypothetical protein